MKKPKSKHKAKAKAKLGKVWVVTSGKGGVGKTTSTAAMGASLAQAGQKMTRRQYERALQDEQELRGGR